jgi:Protein of unknown function (DUF2852)
MPVQQWRIAAMTDAHTATADHTYSRSCGGRMKKKWSASEIATMVGGFIVFWPLGLLALGAKLVKGEMWQGAAENVSPWANWKKPEHSGFTKPWERHSFTGNAAFDDYRKEQFAKLDEQRRKLDEERKAFADYLAKLRKAKDQDEFDRFMAERNIVTPKSE